jgi:hypothetical protein
MRMSFAALVMLSAILPATLAAAAVSVSTDKDSYVVGEVVQVTVHNSGPEDLEFVSIPLIAIANTGTQECIYGCAGLPVVTPFPAGDTVTESWDTGAGPDEIGTYVVTPHILGDDSSAQYILSAGVPETDSSWGAIKALYR